MNEERPRFARVELASVDRWPSGLVATLQFGKHAWQVDCDAADLQSFRRFQRLTANQLYLWILHDCQRGRNAAARRAHWQAAVGRAFSNGTDTLD